MIKKKKKKKKKTICIRWIENNNLSGAIPTSLSYLKNLKDMLVLLKLNINVLLILIILFNI